VIKELASPEEDDLLVMAKGLGMRRVSGNVWRSPDS